MSNSLLVGLPEMRVLPLAINVFQDVLAHVY